MAQLSRVPTSLIYKKQENLTNTPVLKTEKAYLKEIKYVKGNWLKRVVKLVKTIKQKKLRKNTY